MMQTVTVPDGMVRRAARELAEHCGLDAAAVVMVGALAVGRHAGRFSMSPSAEERAELLALAGHAGDFNRFIEAATNRAMQFLLRFGVREAILQRAERLEQKTVRQNRR